VSYCFVALGEEWLDGLIDLSLKGGRAGDVVEDPRD